MVETSTEYDTVLELCRDPHRRIVLAVLAHESRSLTVNDLVKTIAKHNHHAPLAEIPKADAMQVQRSLVHAHIPKLVDLSLVEYDDERQLVDPTNQFDQLQPQLSAIVEADPGLEMPVAL